MYPALGTQVPSLWYIGIQLSATCSPVYHINQAFGLYGPKGITWRTGWRTECCRLKLYGDPDLFSGLGSLVLKKQEVLIVNTHHKNYMTKIQKLYKGSPRSFVYLVGGSLPGEAILQMRQLTLSGMIARLTNEDPCNSHALCVYTDSIARAELVKPTR